MTTENVTCASNISDWLIFISSKLKISQTDGIVNNNAIIVLAISTDEKYSLALVNSFLCISIMINLLAIEFKADVNSVTYEIKLFASPTKP